MWKKNIINRRNNCTDIKFKSKLNLTMKLLQARLKPDIKYKTKLNLTMKLLQARLKPKE
jgi:hypothetical protein